MQILKDFFHLFYPKLCTVCEKQLLENEKVLCIDCRDDLPMYRELNYRKNKIAEKFYGRIPIEKGVSFLYFRKKGKTKKIIHQLKYQGRQEIGVFLGNWFGENLKESGMFDAIDIIIPVPLHKKKLKQRGYNQLTKFGERLGSILNIPYLEGVLTKISTTKTQTFKKRFERFVSTETVFLLSDTSVFRDKHILLIDDVITTGATIENCCKELLKTKGIKISIATMAISE